VAGSNYFYRPKYPRLSISELITSNVSYIFNHCCFVYILCRNGESSCQGTNNPAETSQDIPLWISDCINGMQLRFVTYITFLHFPLMFL
jgi:hypothetical protein